MIFSEHFEADECVLMIPKLLLNEKVTKTRPNLAKKHQKILLAESDGVVWLV